LDSTPGAAALAEAELAQFHTLYEEYEMNLLRENDAPMSLNLALPPISIPEINGETGHGSMISLWNWYIINHIRPVKNYIFYRVRFVVKRETS